MTNPLLRPDDRFRRPDLVDKEGRSVFGDVNSTVEPVETPAKNIASSPENSSDANPLTPSAATGPTYEPTYQTMLPHRAYGISWLSACGFLFTCLLVLPFVTVYAGYGIIFGFLGVILSVVAVLQAYEELSGMSRGAIDSSGRDTMIIAYCLALGGVVIGIGVMLWVIIMVMYGVMDLNL
jgi:hypothetical protein